MRYTRRHENRRLERQFPQGPPAAICWTGSPPASPTSVCLQETKLDGRQFSASRELEAAGYRVAFTGQKTYNGVAIVVAASRPTSGRHPGFRRRAEARHRRHRRRRARGVRLRAPTARASIPTNTPTSSLVRRAGSLAEGRTGAPSRLAVLGDYNVAPEDRDVHDPKAWEGQVLVSRAGARSVSGACWPRPEGQLPPVRAARENLHLVGLPHDGLPPQPRPAHRPHPALGTARRRLHRCSIDRDMRKLERPSDHAPVLAEISLTV